VVPARPPKGVGVPLALSVPLFDSIDGGLTIVRHANALTAVIVTVGPLVVYALLCCLLAIVYRAGRREYVNADPERQQAIREYSVTWVNNLVSILRLTKVHAPALKSGESHVRGGKSAVPRQRQSGSPAAKPSTRKIASLE
jgi:hypothetical protein